MDLCDKLQAYIFVGKNTFITFSNGLHNFFITLR